MTQATCHGFRATSAKGKGQLTLVTLTQLPEV